MKSTLRATAHFSPWTVLLCTLAGCAESRTAADSGEPPCSETPERIVQLTHNWPGFAVTDDAVYLGRDAIYRVEKRAGARLERFADSPGMVTKLVVRGEHVYWFTSTDLLVASRDQLATAVQFGDGSPPSERRGVALAASKGAVFAGFKTGDGEYEIVRVAENALQAEPYAQLRAEPPLELVADDDHVYVGSYDKIEVWDSSGSIRSTSRHGLGLIADRESLYWRDDPAQLAASESLPEHETARLYRAPKSSLTPWPIAGLPTSDDLQIAVDSGGDHVYWTDQSGTVTRAAKSGGEGVLFASTGAYDDDDYEKLLALDQTSVYWIGGELGTRATDDDPVWLYRACK